MFNNLMHEDSRVPVKRKSRGRSKGGKGRSGLVQCSSCGQLVPRDKAKRATKRISMVGGPLARELRQKGTYISSASETRYFCVSCAVHRGVVKVRAQEERRYRPSKRRRF